MTGNWQSGLQFDASGNLMVTPISGPVSQLRGALQNTKPIVPYAAVTTVTSGAITNAQTTLPVTAPVGFPTLETFIVGVGLPVTFTASVAGAAAGTLNAVFTVGTFYCEFANGERRYLTVAAGGTAATWTGVLSAEVAITTATLYEYMAVTAGMGTSTWTVTRGYLGTTAEAAGSGSIVKWFPVARQKDTNLNGVPGDFANLIATSLVQYPPANSVAGTPGAVAAIASRIDNTAPIYFTSSALRAAYGAILTSGISNASTPPFTFTVDQVTQFPQSGNFQVCVGNRSGSGEDMLVNVANSTTLNVVTRALNSSVATTFAAATINASVQVRQIDLTGGTTSGANLISIGGNNAGNHFAFTQVAYGPEAETQSNADTLHFLFDGQQFLLFVNGPLLALVIADGVVMHDANYVIEAPIAGNFLHMFDFGSRKPRRISLVLSCALGGIFVDIRDSLQPWDRSADPVFSYDCDSYGQSEGFTFSSVPATNGGLGPLLEIALSLGLTNIDNTLGIGGTGYSQINPSAIRPSLSSSVKRVGALLLSRNPSLFFCAQGHNDTAAATPAGIYNGSTGTIGASGTTLTVGSSTGYPTSFPFIANLDTELLLVTAISGLSWTVTRGYGGSTAASHAASTLSSCSPQLISDCATYYQTLRQKYPNAILTAAHFWQTGSAAGATYWVRPCISSAILQGLTAAGGPWVYVDNFIGTWQNSSGLSGVLSNLGTSTITGTGFGGAPGYAGGHNANNGNADFYIRDDDIHPSNIGCRYLGNVVGNGLRVGILNL